MSFSNHELLRHILDEISFLFRHTQHKSADALRNDELLQRAVTRSLEIIGEATKNLGEPFKQAHPSIEWKKIAGTRDKLIHDYFGVDYDIVWNILAEKLPPLEAFIKDELAKEPS